MTVRKQVAISFIDQAILSAANFLIGIVLIKSVTKTDYGLYVLAYTIILFVVGLQNALITTQMTVLAPSKSRDKQDGFCNSLCIGQYILYVPAAIVAIIIILTLHRVEVISDEQRNLAATIIIVTVGVLFREFYRSFFFLKSQPRNVLIIDVVFVATTATGLLLGWLACREQLHIVALYLFGLASLASGLAAMALGRLSIEIDIRLSLASLKEAFANGRWALGGILLSLIQGQSYVYLLTAMSGPARVAEANAARLFLAPLSLLHMSFARVLLPKWSFMRQNGENAGIIRMAKKAQILLIAIIVIYISIVLFAKDRLIDTLFAKDYQNIGTIILLWGVLSIVQTLRSSDSWILQAFHQFKRLTLANVMSAIAALIIGAALIELYGPAGSIIGMIVAEAILVFTLAKALKDVIRKNPH
jgi:O-antigen/teichoic acid export membrane protein